jgi:hypothetical protein
MATQKIDPRIYVPPVENYEYKEASDTAFGAGVAVEELSLPATSTTTGLMPPENITIIDQIVRKGPDGRTVVDLVIEVQDMPGATEYEVRTAIV